MRTPECYYFDNGCLDSVGCDAVNSKERRDEILSYQLHQLLKEYKFHYKNMFILLSKMRQVTMYTSIGVIYDFQPSTCIYGYEYMDGELTSYVETLIKMKNGSIDLSFEIKDY